MYIHSYVYFAHSALLHYKGTRCNVMRWGLPEDQFPQIFILFLKVICDQNALNSMYIHSYVYFAHSALSHYKGTRCNVMQWGLHLGGGNLWRWIVIVGQCWSMNEDYVLSYPSTDCMDSSLMIHSLRFFWIFSRISMALKILK